MEDLLRVDNSILADPLPIALSRRSGGIGGDTTHLASTCRDVAGVGRTQLIEPGTAQDQTNLQAWCEGKPECHEASHTS